LLRQYFSLELDMDNTILEQATLWANNTYFDAKDRKELTDLIEAGDEAELKERFYKNLEFGTGGLRSIIGMGANRINKYNVRKATQAMANVVLKTNANNPKAAVSFDCRNFSDEFAREVCCVFAANGIKAFLFPELTPTPLLSYAVNYYEADCGVMITASHNPKAYNGYKAYWSDGSQVTPPYDQMVIDQYNELNDWDQVKWIDFEEANANGMIEMIPSDLNEAFYRLIEDVSPQLEMCKENGSNLNIIYTALHGTGAKPCEYISHRMGFANFNNLPEQNNPDGNFSTVATTPNPEDPKALEIAVNKMLETNADLVYGTDPDCDRLGVVVNHQGKPVYLNGNQIGVLLLHYVLDSKKQKGKLGANPTIFKSIVTSYLQDTLGEAYGVRVINTLTGFKWMAKAMADLENNNEDYDFIFASEESFGYMTHNIARDKDGIGAIALMNEVALYYKLQNKNLVDALDDIYEEFGFAQESLIALTFEGISGKEKIDRIMENFRGNQTRSLAGLTPAAFQDFQSSERFDLKTNDKTKIDMTKSNVLGIEFSDGTQLFLRPSGTEPKIKFYTMVQIKEGDLATKKKKASELIQSIESEIHSIVEKL
jgi:phosphoglucomutase